MNIFNRLLQACGTFIGLFLLISFSKSQNITVNTNITNYKGPGYVAAYFSGDNKWHFASIVNGSANFQFLGGCLKSSTPISNSKDGSNGSLDNKEQGQVILKDDFKVYPNPVSNGHVFLEHNKDISERTIVNFVNIDGKMLGSADISNTNKIVLDDSKGIILYQITRSDKVISNGTIINYSKQLKVSTVLTNNNNSSIDPNLAGSLNDLSHQAAQPVGGEYVIISFKHPDLEWERIGRYDVNCYYPNTFNFEVQLPTYSNSAVKTKLPIEVFGRNGHIESVEFVLDNNWSNASHMWFKVHNVQQNGKMQFRLNGSSWYNVSNYASSINMNYSAKRYGGFGGGFSTIDFSYNVNNADFKKGKNTLELRFTRTNDPAVGKPMSNGYRVLEFNVRQGANGKNMLSEFSFEQEDPSSWSPPMSQQTYIDQGENLWLTAKLKDGGGKDIEAKCADCHAKDGRDLKYFNFSNKSIITRAQFHGLTERQGKLIASYIRTRDVSYATKGRPWNPPFQPGPGTDNRTSHEWAAGAGLENVLENDREMVKQMFGSKSPSRTQIDLVTNTQANLNLREIGVAIQFPDWLHWLPKTHPKDLWGSKTWNNSRANKAYVNLIHRFLYQNAAKSYNLINWVEEFHINVREYIYAGGEPELYYWVNKRGWNLDIAKNRGYSAEFIKFNLSLWQGVKLFELMNEFGGQAQAKRIRGAAEKWQWPSNYFSVFQAAAHFTGDHRGTSAFKWQSLTEGIYFSSAWYELQMLLAPGMRSGYIVEPVDWAYNHEHVYKLSDRSKILEPMRFHRNIIKNFQQRDQNRKVSYNVWNMREVSPWRLFSDCNGSQHLVNKLNNYSEGLRGKLLSSMVSSWKRKVDRSYPRQSDWPRKGNPQFGATHWYQIEPTYFRPAYAKNPIVHGREPFIAPNNSSDAVEAIALYRCLTDSRFRYAGLDYNARRDLESWCELHFDVRF